MGGDKPVSKRTRIGRGLLVDALIVALVVPLLALGGDHARPKTWSPPMHSTSADSFEVAATSGVVPGPTLENGQTLFVTATGTANCDVNITGCVYGPGGHGDPDPAYLAPDLPPFSLVGRIAGGDWFLIGEASGPIEGPGLVEFAYNDIPGNYADNDGGFVLELRICTGDCGWLASTSGVTANLHAVSSDHSTTALAVGDDGTILSTTNGGSSWTAQTSNTTSDLYGVALDGLTGAAVGAGGTIVTTSNGGTTWTEQTSNTTENLRAVSIDTTSTNAVGDTGTIVSTFDDGATWVPQTFGSQDLFGVSFSNATQGLAVGAGGTILKTTNGGGDWQGVTSGTTMRLNAVDKIDGLTAWAAGATGIIKTTDGGFTWTVKKTLTNAANGMSFSDQAHAWVVGASDLVFTTNDGGSSFIPQPSGTPAGSLNDVSFAPFSHVGFAVGNGGTILVLRGPPHATLTTLDSSSNPATTGQPVTFTATVTAHGCAVSPFSCGGSSTVNAGTVTFLADGNSTGAPVAIDHGVANSAQVNLAEGTHVIEATYNGAPIFAPSNDGLVQAWQAATSTFEITFPTADLHTDTLPSISGNAPPYVGTPLHPVTVDIYDGDLFTGTIEQQDLATTYAEDGSWSVDVTTPLAGGEHTAIARFGSNFTDPVSFIVDAVTHHIFVTSPLEAATTNALPLITGTAPAYNPHTQTPAITVTVKKTTDDSVAKSGTATYDPAGTFSFQTLLPALAAGDYYVTAALTGIGPDETSDAVNFTVDANLPSVFTTGASTITETGATLNGSVNRNGSTDVHVRFEYGPTDSLGSLTDPQDITSDGDNGFFKELTGLTAGTEYFFRAIAEDGTGHLLAQGLTSHFFTQLAAGAAPKIFSPTDGANGVSQLPVVEGIAPAWSVPQNPEITMVIKQSDGSTVKLDAADYSQDGSFTYYVPSPALGVSRGYTLYAALSGFGATRTSPVVHFSTGTPNITTRTDPIAENPDHSLQVDDTSATLRGMVNRNGYTDDQTFGVLGFFRKDGGPTLRPAPKTIDTDGDIAVVTTVTDLDPATDYGYQMLAVNSSGDVVARGAYRYFTTTGSPRPDTSPVVYGTPQVDGELHCWQGRLHGATSFKYRFFTKNKDGSEDVLGDHDTIDDFYHPELTDAGTNIGCKAIATTPSGSQTHTSQNVLKITKLKEGDTTPISGKMPGFLRGGKACKSTATKPACTEDDVREYFSDHGFNAQFVTHAVESGDLPSDQASVVRPGEVVGFNATPGDHAPWTGQTPPAGGTFTTSATSVLLVHLGIFDPPDPTAVGCNLKASSTVGTRKFKLGDQLLNQTWWDARQTLRAFGCYSLGGNGQMTNVQFTETDIVDLAAVSPRVTQVDNKGAPVHITVTMPPQQLQPKFLADEGAPSLALGDQKLNTSTTPVTNKFGVLVQSAGKGFSGDDDVDLTQLKGKVDAELRDPSGKVIDSATTDELGIAHFDVSLATPGSYTVTLLAIDLYGNAMWGTHPIDVVKRTANYTTLTGESFNASGHQMVTQTRGHSRAGFSSSESKNIAKLMEAAGDIAAIYDFNSLPAGFPAGMTEDERLGIFVYPKMLRDFAENSLQLEDFAQFNMRVTVSTASGGAGGLCLNPGTLAKQSQLVYAAGKVSSEKLPAVIPDGCGAVGFTFLPHFVTSSNGTPTLFPGATFYTGGAFAFDEPGGVLVGSAPLAPAPVKLKSPNTVLAGAAQGSSNTAATTGTVAPSLIAKLISNDGGSLIGNDGGGLIGNDGAGIIASGGGNVISNDGSSLIGNDGAGIVGACGGCH